MVTKITLSGFAGSGKSTVGKLIQERLHFEFISVGNFSREYAKTKYGMTINEFQETCKKEPELDTLIDSKFQIECNCKENLIIDYRLGFKFISDAFHVLLKVSEEQGATRINLDNRENESVSAIDIKHRNEGMRDRFASKYGVDFSNEKHYDLVINTDKFSPKEVASIIIENFKN